MRRLLRVTAALALLATSALMRPSEAAAAPRPYPAECAFGMAVHAATHGVDAWQVRVEPGTDGTYMGLGDDCSVGKTLLRMQDDGNLVVYDEYGSARWAASWTRPNVINNATEVDWQSDGNLVLYEQTTYPRIAHWASDTCCGNGATLAVQADGNVVIYAANGTAKWSTTSAH